MEDDFGDDADFAAALEASERAMAPKPSVAAPPRSGGSNPASAAPRVQQPKPQALPTRAGPSSILVSPRQKGNPILNNIRSMPWEYSDIPADFVLGNTTCALFLSLKYHRLHPEYIYSRIRALAGKYNLRILLTMVDIQNHEESLKELSKTSLINNVTVILCWSAQEAGRYLELYKSYEHAAPTSIRAHQSTSYSDKLVEFITVPRSINKTDAVGLVSNFGSVRTAINAKPEEVALVAGWGEKKVQRWCQTVHEPFRVKKAAKRGITRENSRAALSKDISSAGIEADQRVAARLGIGAPLPVGVSPSRQTASAGATQDADRRPSTRLAEHIPTWEPGEDEEEAMLEAARIDVPEVQSKLNDNALSRTRKAPEDEPSKGVMAALAKLRKQG
ncbi:DNA repair protein rad10 [Cryomyces antarcticus]